MQNRQPVVFMVDRIFKLDELGAPLNTRNLGHPLYIGLVDDTNECIQNLRRVSYDNVERAFSRVANVVGTGFGGAILMGVSPMIRWTIETPDISRTGSFISRFFVFDSSLSSFAFYIPTYMIDFQNLRVSQDSHIYTYITKEIKE